MMNLNERRAWAAERAEQLQEVLGEQTNYRQANAIAATRGYCAYCCVDLLQKHSPLHAVDHIVPRDQYPHYSNDPRNLTFSCAACNSFKGEANPVREDEGEDAEHMLEHCHAELIERSRVHVCLQRTESELGWRATARQIIRG